MTTRHLDLGCRPCPRNTHQCDEVHAVDWVIPDRLDPLRFRYANPSLEPIPHADSSFDSISAFDSLGFVPRVLNTADERGTRSAFLDLMSEIHRMLVPAGRFYALTPAYPSVEAFQDPTHVNVITEGTRRYFCGDVPMVRPYGFTGAFEMRRNERAMYPEAFEPLEAARWRRLYGPRRFIAKDNYSPLMWQFACVKPVA